MKLLSIFLVTVLVASLANADELYKPFEIKSKGFELVMNSIRSLAFGGETGDNIYKDLFINTANDFYVTLENSNDQITFDDILRIFIQSVIILSTNRRADLIPRDFHEKNPEFKDFILELNSVLDLLSKKGSNSVTLGKTRRIFASLRNEKFWDAIVELNSVVKASIEEEERKEKEKANPALEGDNDEDDDGEDDDEDDDGDKEKAKAEL